MSVLAFSGRNPWCALEDRGIEWSELEDPGGLHGGGDLELNLEGNFQEYRRGLCQEEGA